MKILMVAKGVHEGKTTARKVVFVVMAFFVVSIVLLNLLHYFVSYK